MNDLCAKVVTLKNVHHYNNLDLDLQQSRVTRLWWTSRDHVVVGHVTIYVCHMTVSATLHTRIASRTGRQPVFAQRHFSLPYSQSARAWITQFYMQITPCLPFLCKRSPDGATTNWGSRHPIAAYYTFIDPKEMIGWVGLVGWPIA